MSFLKIYSEATVKPYLKVRAGETKLGEKVQFVKDLESLKTCTANYVLLGIPEDIGVRANYGQEGTSKAWEVALSSFLNIQHNPFTKSENIIVLGEIDCDTQMQQARTLSENEGHSVEKLGELVSQIDHKVSTVIQAIVAAGKFPIIIGGGHNNSYGNLKGTSQALDKSVNCVNFDAHSDFRSLEHRHSGNGFSYAFEEGFLKKYFIFGLHRNYTSTNIFEMLLKNVKTIQFTFFEDIVISEKITFQNAIKEAENFSCQDNFGLELDMDAVENFGSSAISPSGFTLTEARKFVSYFSENKNCRYLHICEGSPEKGIFPNQVGKSISYLISDVIVN